jgi:hypothetical protein
MDVICRSGKVARSKNCLLSLVMGQTLIVNTIGSREFKKCLCKLGFQVQGKMHVKIHYCLILPANLLIEPYP